MVMILRYFGSGCMVKKLCILIGLVWKFGIKLGENFVLVCICLIIIEMNEYY